MHAQLRRGRGDTGATLLESAIITPVLMLFVFGIFEFGFAFRDYLTVANATRDAAREASVSGDSVDADYRMLRAVQRGAAALPDGALEQIVIWDASGPGDSVPSACVSGGSQTGVCNVYTPADIAVPEHQFGCQKTSDGDPYDSPDRFWCPNDREVSVSSGNPLDYVGIYIRTTHQYITGLFGDDVVFEDTMILRVEPQE